jgi:hypothetical protein
MRAIGLFLAAIGIALATYSLTVDTSVSTGAGFRAHNISLASQQAIGLATAITLFTAGIILYAAGEVVVAVKQIGQTPGDSSVTVPFYYRYDPQLLGSVVLIAALTAGGLIYWLYG